MILRAVPLVLWCSIAGALVPVPSATDDDCALYLAGPGRTSAYDYTLNLLRGNVALEGQQTCITYDAINQAYIEARKRILVAQPKGDWKPEDYASVGELILDISINLARTYGLTYEEIEKGLPLIETSRTLISEVCPPVFSHVECRAGKYRRLDGLCNNLHNPTWGSTNVPFQRLIGPLYADGINAPRISHTGRDLPLSRVVSRTMHPDEGYHDHAGTVMIIAWGQFMDHDFTLTATPLDPRVRNDPEECCTRPPHQKHPYCNEIRIPDDDYFYRLFGVKCMDFVRAFPSPRPGCRLGSRVPFNTLTGVIDGNTVYGVTDKFARKLRTGYGGLLRMNDVFREYGLKDLLPLKLDIPDEGCTRPNKHMYCFEAGEIRVNEQLVLTVMHTLMAREHNRLAKGLAAVNPHWDDETLYQEARRINIAEIQHITYNEFLPILLGKDVMAKFGLVLEKAGYWEGYDPQVNPDIIDSFAAAAFRVGHTFLPTAVERWSKAHKFIASKRLSDLIRRPYDLYRAGVLDEYVMGLMNQVAQAMDDSITQEVTNHLFKKVGARFGMDLVAFNMQRGREFGVPGYMEFRKFCGLPGANSFQDLFGSMPNETVRRYESIFEHPIDVDLWSGGVSERPLPGSMLGPTFACIIATQFAYARRGDRFWYELPNQPSSFTPAQLEEVRKARLSRVICDNTDIIDTVQLYPMVLPDHELNPRVPCRSGIIPSIDFSKWAEPPPHVGAKHLVTDAIIQSNNRSLFGIGVEICEEVFTTTHATIENKPNQDRNNANCTEAPHPEAANSLNLTLFNNSDTVLKYIHKKGDNVTSKKNQANPYNSLRKKRSLHNIQEHEKQPLIVNYEAPPMRDNQDIPQLFLNYETYPPTAQLGLLPLPKNTNKFLKSSDLASFDIQTLHGTLPDTNPDYTPNNKLHAIKENKQYYLGEPLYPVSYYADMRDGIIHKLPRNNSPYKASNDKYSQQKTGTHVDSPDLAEDISMINAIYSDNGDSTSKEITSVEVDLSDGINNDSSEGKLQNGGSYETKEKYGISNRKDESHSHKVLKEMSSSKEPSHHNADYQERSDTLTNLKKKVRYNNEDSKKQKISEEVEENSKEKYDEIMKTKINQEHRHKGSPVNENELNEFSYEQIKLDENGKVVPDIPKPLNTTTIRPTNVEKENYKYLKKVNDGEIRPVFEISNISGETLSERVIDDDVKTLSKTSSIEILDETLEENHKSITKQPETKTLKNDFERIPLNYSHGNINSSADIADKTLSQSPEESEDVDDDTPFIIPENHIPYDDHLYYKFGDPTVILPDINLPEDIIAYAYDGPYGGKVQKNKGRYSENDLKDDDKQNKNRGDVINEDKEIPKGPSHPNHHEEEELNRHYDAGHDHYRVKKPNSQEEAESQDDGDHHSGEYEDDQEDEEHYQEDNNGHQEDDNRHIEEDNRQRIDDETTVEHDHDHQEHGDNREEKDRGHKEDEHFGHHEQSSQEDEPQQQNKNKEEDNNRGHPSVQQEPDPGAYEEEDVGEEDESEKNTNEALEENSEENHHEDLYEKFVRERFGKTDTFEERVARLQDDRFKSSNPQLKENVNKLLKRAGNTQVEAAKSADPNAGFMWTLEYGENL